MARATGIIKRLDKVLKLVAPPERKVYKRTVTRTGGDDLIGRPGTVTTSDTLLTPQPFYVRAGNVRVPDAQSETFLSSSDKRSVGEDYVLLVSPNALSWSEISNKDLMLVFKDAAGVEEVYRITDFEPLALEATDVMYMVNVRSTKR